MHPRYFLGVAKELPGIVKSWPGGLRPGAAHQLPEMLVVLRERASAAQRSEAANPEGVTRAKRGIAAFMLCVVFRFLNCTLQSHTDCVVLFLISAFHPLSYQFLKAILCSPFHLLNQVYRL